MILLHKFKRVFANSTMFLCIALLLQGCVNLQTKHNFQQGKQLFQNKQYSLAYQQLKPLAEKGNPDAQYAVGYMYYYGKGIVQNKNIGFSWILKAAKQGQPQAKRALDIFQNSALF